MEYGDAVRYAEKELKFVERYGYSRGQLALLQSGCFTARIMTEKEAAAEIRRLRRTMGLEARMSVSTEPTKAAPKPKTDTVELPREIAQEISAALGSAYGWLDLAGAENAKRTVGDAYSTLRMYL